MSFFSKLFGPKTDFKSLVNKGAVIIDVRTPGEYNSEHIKGSLNIPVDTVKNKITELKQKNKPVITCCASGMRSGMAKTILKQNGIEAYNGGSWVSLNNKINS
jgi:phage shock protein E